MHSPEKREIAAQLRHNGMLCREIAEQIGVPKSTVIRWLNPQTIKTDRKKARVRKYSKKRKCPSCGKRISNTSALCRECYRAQQRYWTRDRVLRAFKEWAAANGRVPTQADWERSGKGRPALRSVTYGPDMPFQSWAELVTEAGFEPRRRGKNRRLSPAQRAKIRRELREEDIRKALEREDDV